MNFEANDHFWEFEPFLKNQPLHRKEFKRVLGPIVEMKYKEFFNVEGVLTCEKCSLERIIVNTKNSEVFMNNLRNVRPIAIVFDTSYSMGTNAVEHIYACIDCGTVHLCGDECNTAYINSCSSYTCDLTGLEVRAADFALEWQAEAGNQKLWNQGLNLREVDHTLPTSTKHVMVNGVLTKIEFVVRYLEMAVHTLKPFESSYSVVLLRYKLFFHELFFGQTRQKLDAERHNSSMSDIRKKINSYKLNRKWKVYTHARRIVTSMTRKQFKPFDIPIDRMDPFITFFVQKIVRLMLVIALHSSEFKNNRNKYPPDYIFIATIIFMRNAGLKIGDVQVLQHHPYLSNFMITTNLLTKFSFRQNYTTDCSTAIRKALNFFNKPLSEINFDATPEDWQLWNRHANMMAMCKKKGEEDDFYDDVRDE